MPVADERDARIPQNLASIRRHLGECVDLAARGRDAYFGADFVNRYAAYAALIQIGNPVKDLPDEFRRAHPEVSWRALMHARDKVGHIYGDGIDWDVIWETIRADAPDDLAAIERIVG